MRNSKLKLSSSPNRLDYWLLFSTGAHRPYL